MKVHKTMGNGFQEVIYQRCLAIELGNAGIDFLREQEMPIYYDGNHVGTRRADFIVAGEVMVELKALIKLEDVHLAQALNYLTAYQIDKGLLITSDLTAWKSNASSANINPVNPFILSILIPTI